MGCACNRQQIENQKVNKETLLPNQNQQERRVIQSRQLDSDIQQMSIDSKLLTAVPLEENALKNGTYLNQLINQQENQNINIQERPSKEIQQKVDNSVQSLEKSSARHNTYKELDFQSEIMVENKSPVNQSIKSKEDIETEISKQKDQQNCQKEIQDGQLFLTQIESITNDQQNENQISLQEKNLEMSPNFLKTQTMSQENVYKFKKQLKMDDKQHLEKFRQINQEEIDKPLRKQLEEMGLLDKTSPNNQNMINQKINFETQNSLSKDKQSINQVEKDRYQHYHTSNQTNSIEYDPILIKLKGKSFSDNEAFDQNEISTKKKPIIPLEMDFNFLDEKSIQAQQLQTFSSQ